MVRLKKQGLIGPLNQRSCDTTHKPAVGGGNLLFEMILAELGLATCQEPVSMGLLKIEAERYMIQVQET
jgi:hypothetical protein